MERSHLIDIKAGIVRAAGIHPLLRADLVLGFNQPGPLMPPPTGKIPEKRLVRLLLYDDLADFLAGHAGAQIWKRYAQQRELTVTTRD